MTLVERLRAEVEHQDRLTGISTLQESANRIEELTAAVGALSEALTPFAEVADHDIGADEDDADTFRPMTNYNSVAKITVGDMRRALYAIIAAGMEARK